MANQNTKWYLNYGNGSSTGYYAVATWTNSHSYSVAALVRQLTAPSVGNERVYVCRTSGTSSVTEPTWNTGKGSVTTDNTVVWLEATGQPAINGDSTNTPAWVNGTAYSIGQIIKNTAGTYYFICGTALTSGGSEPTWNTTPGVTTSDNSVANAWYCLGAIGTIFTTGWAGPHARLANAFASGWAAAGDTIFTSNNHAETQSTAMTLASPGTASNPARVQCVSDANSPPTTSATTATVATTGASAITKSGYAYVYGVTVTTGSGSSAANMQVMASGSAANGWWYFDNCALVLGTTSASSQFKFGGGNRDDAVILNNTTVKFGATGQSIATGGYFEWKNTASAVNTGGSVPTTLFSPVLGILGLAVITGVDLSALGSGKSLVAPVGSFYDFYFRNCKLGGSVSACSGAISGGGGSTQVYLENCDSSGTNYRMEHYKYQGSIKQETTLIMTSGASDGTTGISHNLTSVSTGPTLFSPLEGPWVTIWNDTTGASKTVTVEFLHDKNNNGGADLTNADIYLEVEALTTSSYPKSVYYSNRVADIFATATAHAAGTGTGNWTTTGMTTPDSQKLVSPSFTPAFKGPIRARVCLVKSNYTVYVNPVLTVA